MDEVFKKGKSYHFSLASTANMFYIAEHCWLKEKMQVKDILFEDLMCFTVKGNKILSKGRPGDFYSYSYCQKFLKSNGFNFVKPSIDTDIDPVAIAAFSLSLYGNIIVNGVTREFLSNFDESPFYLAVNPKYALAYTYVDKDGLKHTVGGKVSAVPGGRNRFTSVVFIRADGHKYPEVYIIGGTETSTSTYEALTDTMCSQPGNPITEGVDFVTNMLSGVKTDSVLEENGSDSEGIGSGGDVSGDISDENASNPPKKRRRKLSIYHIFIIFKLIYICLDAW